MGSKKDIVCPKCKKETTPVRDAALVLRKGKLIPLAGFYCEWCCHSWIMDWQVRP